MNTLRQNKIRSLRQNFLSHFVYNNYLEDRFIKSSYQKVKN